MALRFNKRIKIAPGIKLNVGLGGINTTVGVKGASVNVGKKGTYANVGIPGTGISSRTKIAGKASAKKSTISTPKVERVAPLEKQKSGVGRLFLWRLESSPLLQSLL